MVPVSALSQGVIRDANDQTIADYYDRKKNSTINTPPNGSDLHHHHLGVGEFDHTDAVEDACGGRVGHKGDFVAGRHLPCVHSYRVSWTHPHQISDAARFQE